MNALVQNYYNKSIKHNAWNPLDQHVFLLRRFPDSTEPEELIEFIKENGVLLSVVTYLQVSPARVVLPAMDVFRKGQRGVVISNQAVRGRLGQNMQPEQANTYFQRLQRFFDPQSTIVHDEQVYLIPQIAVVFKNDFKFPFMSCVLIRDVVLSAESAQFEISTTPTQSVFQLSAKEVIYIDIPQSVSEKYSIFGREG